MAKKKRKEMTRHSKYIKIEHNLIPNKSGKIAKCLPGKISISKPSEIS